MPDQKKIIYIGNLLVRHGLTPTSISTLGEKLSELAPLIQSSDKINKVQRLFDMIFTILRYKGSIKVVLIDTYSGIAFIYAFFSAMICRLYGINYIPIIRGGGLPEILLRKKSIANMVFLYSKINISPSKYMKLVFEKNGFRSEYLPNSIDVAKYNFQHRLRTSPKLIWVRSFHKVYNPQMAIRVLFRLKAIKPDAVLYMVGPEKDGTMRDCKNLVAKLGMENSIFFTGILTKEEWKTHAMQSDIFLNTTNFDNQPVSVLEAMALGLPIVSTNVGGLPYLHKNGYDAILTAKDDADAMVGSILKILNSEKLSSQLSLRARKKAESFDWKKIKSSWEKILNIKNDSCVNNNEKINKNIYRRYMNERIFGKKWSNKNIGNLIIHKEKLTISKQLLKKNEINLENNKILDVGCAGGDTVKILIELGAKEKNITGIDLRQDRLDAAKKIYPKANFLKMDAGNLKFSSGKFDFINIFTLFSSVNDLESRFKISNEIQRVLKPNGFILYYDLRYNNPANKDVVGIHRDELWLLFSRMKKNINTLTILPPLVRMLGSYTQTLYKIFSKAPVLRTHYIGLFGNNKN